MFFLRHSVLLLQLLQSQYYHVVGCRLSHCHSVGRWWLWNSVRLLQAVSCRLFARHSTSAIRYGGRCLSRLVIIVSATTNMNDSFMNSHWPASNYTVWTTCPESWHELESNLQLLSSTQYAPTAYNNKLTLKKRTVNANLHTGARDDKNLVYKLDRKVFNKRLDKNQQDWCWSIAQCIFNTSWTMDQGLRISNKQNHSPVRCWVFDFLCLRVCCFLLSFLTWTYKAQSFIFQKH